MGAIGTDEVTKAAKASPLHAKYGQTIEQPEPPLITTGGQAPSIPDYPGLPTDYELPPMPAPAEPKGPAVWEEVLKNPTVKSGINTAIREAVRSIFGSGRRRR